MDIIDSFIKSDNIYQFTPIAGDASKKKFYEIKNNDNLFLMQITIEPGSCDEDFDEGKGKYSQYEYFKYSVNFLSAIGNVPKIIATNDDHGIVVIEKVGDTRLKEYLEQNRTDTKYIYQAIDWIVKLSNYNVLDDMMSERIYDRVAMEKEIERFMNWTLKYANNYDKLKFLNGIEKIFKELTTTHIVYNHRDYHLRNIMVKNDQIYVIDSQDMCIGPAYCDIASLLFNPNVVFTMEERKTYAKYFYSKAKIDSSFSDFYRQLLHYGFIRVLKSYGWHSQYFVRDGRWLSQEQICNNNKTLLELSKAINPNPVFDVINKYKIIPIVLCAGKGSRMKNDNLPKPLCEINGRPMLFRILDKLVKLNPYEIIIVVGHRKEMIIEKLKEYPYKNIRFVTQHNQLGTGHAVMMCRDILQDFPGQLIILFGDKPAITVKTLQKMVDDFFTKDLDANLVTYKGNTSYKTPGRIIKNSIGEIIDVCEDVNVNYPSNEFSGGIQMYNCTKFFDNIFDIQNNNTKKEYYLADIIKIMSKLNYRIGTTIINNSNELINVNTIDELKYANKLLN